MTHTERYTLLMHGARDHYRCGEWRICRDYLQDALRLACARELERGDTWSDRRRFANACILTLERLMAGCGLA